MHKTTVYALFNGSIAHQTQEISEKRWYYAARYCL